MHRLDAAFQSRLLHFNEVSNRGFLFQCRVHAQMRKRPDGTVRRDFRVDDDRVILHDDVVSELGVRNASARSNHTLFTDHRLSFNRHVRMNDSVATDLSFRTDVGMRGINKRHATFDHQPSNRIAADQIFKLREFGACVDARNLARVRVRENFNLATRRENDLGNVSQVILTLLVLRFDSLQRLE
jgi:hypothetical protein